MSAYSSSSLSELITTSFLHSYGTDPVHRHLLPMFGLRYNGAGRTVRRLDTTQIRVEKKTGFRTSRLPKSPLTPEIESKIKALSLYHALLRSSKGPISLHNRTRRHYSSTLHRGLKSIRPLRPTQLYTPPELSENQGRCERGNLTPVRRTVQVILRTDRRNSPKNRPASRDSHLSIPTPLAPIYHPVQPSSRLTLPLRRLRQSI